MAAVKTLKQVDTLILGGFDRGIDYTGLTGFLKQFTGIRVVFTGPAGKRMMEELNLAGDRKNTPVFITDFRQAVAMAIDITPPGGICLLSPAASSYDCFNNFEERGKCFKELVSK
jgi:UDP-N-acetylmuramoylalanine-D-glutamate ligase